MVNNKSTDDKCVACTTSKPGSAPTAAANVTGAPSVSSTVSGSLVYSYILVTYATIVNLHHWFFIHKK